MMLQIAPTHWYSWDIRVTDESRPVLARAEKPSVFRREFVIRHAGREYTLRPESMFRRAFVLLDDSRQIGSLAPKSAFTR